MDALRILAAVALGFFLPGYFLSRLLGSTVTLASSYLLSQIVLFFSVLALNTVGIPIRYSTVSVLLVLATAAAALAAWRYPRDPAPTPDPPKSELRWLSWLAVSGVAAVFTARALLQPLSGWDGHWRWDWLARMILSLEHLRFYPPTTAADFDVYSQADGIPPLVSISYFYLYAAAGRALPVLSAIPVLLQASCIALLARRLAGEIRPQGAAEATVLILCSSPLLFWAVAMGQETGVTTLGLLATLYFATLARRDPRWSTAVLAGSSAAICALAREYGIAFVACGAVASVWCRAGRRWLVGFLVTAGVLAAPWYLRNWVLTGNPVYDLRVDSLFPVNVVHAGIMDGYREFFGFGSNTAGKILEASRLLVQTSLVAIALGLAGASRAFRSAGHLVVSVVVVFGLWILSVGYTAGGLLYSTRVLGPALAVLAVLGGVFLSDLASERAARARAATLVLVAAVGYAGVYDLTVPGSPITIPPSLWRRAGFSRIPVDLVTRNLEWVAREADGAILSDNPYAHAALRPLGVRVVSAQSPEVGFLFHDSPDLATGARVLRERGITHVLTYEAHAANLYLRRVRFYEELFRDVPPVAARNGSVLFRLP